MPPEASHAVLSLIAEFPRERTWLVPALQTLHETEGWLSFDTLAAVAEHLGMSPSEVYEAATQYPAFRLTKPGDHVVRVCTGLSCRLTGSRALLCAAEDRFRIRCGQTTPDSRLTLEDADCLLLCSVAPVVEVDGDYHGRVTLDQVRHLPIWFRTRMPPDLGVQPCGLTWSPGAGQSAQERLASLRSRAEARARRRAEFRFLVQGSACGQALGAWDVVKALRILTAMRGLPAEVLKGGCHGMCCGAIVVEVQRIGWPWLTFTHLTKDAIPDFLSKVVSTEASLNSLHGMAWNEEGWRGLPPATRHPFFAGQHRLLMERCGHIDPEDLDDALLTGGYAALAEVLDRQLPEEVITAVKTSGLQGWGGAYLSTALKWEACRKASGEPKYSIMSGQEGQPGIFKHRHLMEGDPHRVLEGLLLAAYAAGTRRAILCINGAAPLSFRRMARAVAQARAAGLIGDRILGSAFSCHVELRRGPGGSVLAEETALLELIEGRRAAPKPGSPLSAASGLCGKPTVINDVETLAGVSVLLARERARFTGLGRGNVVGAKLVGLSGPVNRPGIVEVEMGVTLRQLLFSMAGGLRDGQALKAIVVGGGSGTVVGLEFLDTPVEPPGARSFTASGIIPVPEGESADIEDNAKGSCRTHAPTAEAPPGFSSCRGS